MILLIGLSSNIHVMFQVDLKPKHGLKSFQKVIIRSYSPLLEANLGQQLEAELCIKFSLMFLIILRFIFGIQVGIQFNLQVSISELVLWFEIEQESMVFYNQESFLFLFWGGGGRGVYLFIFFFSFFFCPLYVVVFVSNNLSPVLRELERYIYIYIYKYACMYVCIYIYKQRKGQKRNKRRAVGRGAVHLPSTAERTGHRWRRRSRGRGHFWCGGMTSSVAWWRH